MWKEKKSKSLQFNQLLRDANHSERRRRIEKKAAENQSRASTLTGSNAVEYEIELEESRSS